MAVKYKVTSAVVLVAIVALIAFKLGRRTRPQLPFSPPPTATRSLCFDFHEAASHVGENGCVTGYVFRAFTSKAGNTFLDFCADYRGCPFTSVIFAADRAKFGNLQTLEGQKVALRGFISTYHDQAEIVIHDPWQIQMSQ